MRTTGRSFPLPAPHEVGGQPARHAIGGTGTLEPAELIAAVTITRDCGGGIRSWCAHEAVPEHGLADDLQRRPWPNSPHSPGAAARRCRLQHPHANAYALAGARLTAFERQWSLLSELARPRITGGLQIVYSFARPARRLVHTKFARNPRKSRRFPHRSTRPPGGEPPRIAAVSDSLFPREQNLNRRAPPNGARRQWCAPHTGGSNEQ